MSSLPEPTAVELDRIRRFVADVLARKDRLGGDPPPERLVEVHHLGPIAYRMGMGGFRDVYAASAVMAARRAELLADLASNLSSRGVRVALIKGIAHAGDIYLVPAERPMLDIDLLVMRRDLPEAMRCISDRGFVRVSRAPGTRALSGYHHAITFARGDMLVELHRNIVQQDRTGIRIGDIWRRTRSATPHGCERLDPVDDLIFSALHIARGELLAPILNYVDVARLLDRLDAASRVELGRRVAAYRIGRPIRAVLAVLDLLRRARDGRLPVPGGWALPSMREILTGVRPTRRRQILQKVLLTEGLPEIAGLGLGVGRAMVQVRRRRR